MQKRYSHIFFDLDNTLWDFEKNSFLAMKTAFDYFIANDEASYNNFFEVYIKHNKRLWEGYRNKQVSKKELTRKRFELTFEELNIRHVDPDKMNEYYLTKMPGQKHLNPGVFELLEYLKQKKYYLSIITNGFTEVQIKKLETSGISGYFQKIFISESVKTPKPGKDIFEFAIKSTNARKLKSIMIGDDWDVDILGAYQYGIDSVYYQPGIITELQASFGRNKNNIIHFIQNFNELKNIL
jgi:putative hydrolase of the HAD superfamily